MLEQRGIVVAVTNLVAPSRTVFLDLSDPTFQGPEEGLVSLAIHPGHLPRHASGGFPHHPGVPLRYTPPLFAYSHGDGSCVMGGVVYRGSRFSSLYGWSLFSDHSFGWVTALKRNPDGSTDLVSLGYQPGVTSVEVNEATDDVWFSEVSQNRIWKLTYSGVFTGEHLPGLAAANRSTASLEWRARSYLDANCSGCHRPGGSGLGLLDARLQTPTALNGMVDGALLAPGTDPLDRVIVPGKPEHSVLLRRLSTRGPVPMPPLASAVADAAGAELIREWILSLATPAPGAPAVIAPVPLEEGVALRIARPAHRRLRIEHARELLPQVWEPLDVPGTEWEFPAVSGDVELPVNLAPDSGFFRVLTLAP